MIKFSTPESCGVSSAKIHKFISQLNRRQMHMHSVLMMRGDSIIYEGYWAPFTCDFNHRMYSVTKSFVSVAVGLCVEDGLFCLDDKIVDLFPEKLDPGINEHLKKQTVREMLTMTTTCCPCGWFGETDPDRTHLYFNKEGYRRPSGTIWEYDSSGSQVLSSLVEKVTGKRLFDYLNERIFTHLGTFKNAKILQTPNGDSWGDSAMICTTRDLASFARFVMSYGVHNGKRLMNEEYLREATKKQVDNNWDIHMHVFHHGYGYQIWKGPDDSFAFVGMGDQLAVCIPKYDFIFCCTADNQGNESARDYIIYQLWDCIIDEISNSPLEENPNEQKRLSLLNDSLKLFAAQGKADSPWREKLDGVTYACPPNEMDLKEFTFSFDGSSGGTLSYERGGRKMELPFYINKNRFGSFPELGYAKERGRVRTTDGHMYKDAVSAAWLQDNKLMLFVQIIDEYFGNASLTFAFKDDEATVLFHKIAEDFLWGYEGQVGAKRL
ncbi:MAG: serine hydrolase [Clostridia bacterium]|nr:serine hydrolase [Clostridia bacterium]